MYAESVIAGGLCCQRLLNWCGSGERSRSNDCVGGIVGETVNRQLVVTRESGSAGGETRRILTSQL